MRIDVSRVDMWVASIEDVPGGLAEKLDTLANADVDLEFVSARRAPDKPGKGVVFVTPIKGPKQIRAAKKAGFAKSKSLFAIRVATGNKPGYSADLTLRLAKAGLNLRGISGAAISNRAVFYIAFDSSADAGKAVRLIK
ncbi:MAG: hypothetical protein PVH77_12930 [Phycisphaerales bacterium]|jgi:hypothetical protein